MPRSRDSDSSAEGDPLRRSLWQRLRAAIVKPVDPAEVSKVTPTAQPRSVDELEAAVKSADDKERLLGLVAAPFAAAIGFLVITTLIDHDPSAFLANGQANKLHVSVSLYHDLIGVLLVMSVLMLVLALRRKRLYLGMVMALYGLAIFNLHYWGFGIPFILGGAWLLTRAYRLQQQLRGATGDGKGSGAGRRGGGVARNGSRPRSNKRYTPPSPKPTRPSLQPKPDNEQKAG